MRNATFAASLMAASLFANPDLEHQVTILECKMNSVRDDTVYPCRAGARFATGRPFYCGYGLWGTVDVLYWTAFEGGSDYAYMSSSPTTSFEVGTVYKAKFDWDPGYRIGFSYSWPQDNWDLGVYFTRIEPEANNSVKTHSDAERIGSLFTASDLALLTHASIDWNAKLSALDFEYGRSYFISRYLLLRPHFGARVGWVHQKANATYRNDTTTETVFGRNDFDGAGLRLGSDSKWFLDRHWNLNLNASAAALYGHFKVQNVRTVTGGSTYSSNMNSNNYRVVPTAQASLGLGWETFFSNEGNHLSLMAAYEVNYWWRQNQMMFFDVADGAPFGTRYSDDLGFHGFTFDVQISF